MFRYIAKYNIHLGLAAAISGFSYSVLLNNFTNYESAILLFAIQFLVTVAAYNYFRKRIKLTWQIPLVIVFLISFYFDYYFQIILLSIGLIAFFYQLPIKLKLGFRFFSFLKPFIVGLCWASTIILLSTYSITNSINLIDISFVLLVIKFLEISALAIANDLLHIPKDKMNGVKTFPIAYGLSVSKLSVILLSIVQLICCFVLAQKFATSIGFIVSSVLSFILIATSIILIHFKKNRGVEILLDIIIGVEALFLLAFIYFF
jgi:4-hydroxybenzoate polyprenyltransferase